MNEKTILLTGGLGFIGSHTCIELLNNGYRNIVVIDNLSNSQYDQIEKIEKLSNAKINVYIGDMLDGKLLERIFSENKITHVIHLAGLKSVNDSITNPLDYYIINLQILTNLLNVMKKNECKNIVFSSSATVYGMNTYTNGVNENYSTGINLTNPYGKTKYFQEEILKDLYKSDASWNITILRYFNPVANHSSKIIRENPNGTPGNLFPCITQSIRNKSILKIYGKDYATHDGTCIRDFIHVVDLANAHVCVLNCRNLNIYNVGTGKKTSVFDIVTTFEQINQIKLDYVFADRRDGDVECIYSDCSKIEREIGWKAMRNIDDMCRDAFID